MSLQPALDCCDPQRMLKLSQQRKEGSKVLVLCKSGVPWWIYLMTRSLPTLCRTQKLKAIDQELFSLLCSPGNRALITSSGRMIFIAVRIGAPASSCEDLLIVWGMLCSVWDVIRCDLEFHALLQGHPKLMPVCSCHEFVVCFKLSWLHFPQKKVVVERCDNCVKFHCVNVRKISCLIQCCKLLIVYPKMIFVGFVLVLSRG